MIRVYREDYIKWYPQRWRWELTNTIEQNELYLRTRARRSNSKPYRDMDILPDFSSIERDADQFEREQVCWTDIWGLVWEGKKGVHAYAGPPDYEGHLYYYALEDEWEEEGWRVSDEYDSYKHQPPESIYTCLDSQHGKMWIDTANIASVEYHYIVNNHLFKDTRIEIVYDDGDRETIYWDYQGFIDGLVARNKKGCLSVLMKKMNEHFVKLKISEREEVRNYYPGKTAEEMFLAREGGDL